mmetsp:Transcript_52319/g.156113  ORF Transcript_52319/g.156113 Transcript_52319/m.156113 type:complete len:286 (-) Transcript_52319:106-963(-)
MAARGHLRRSLHGRRCTLGMSLRRPLLRRRPGGERCPCFRHVWTRLPPWPQLRWALPLHSWLLPTWPHSWCIALALALLHEGLVATLAETRRWAARRLGLLSIASPLAETFASLALLCVLRAWALLPRSLDALTLNLTIRAHGLILWRGTPRRRGAASMTRLRHDTWHRVLRRGGCLGLCGTGLGLQRCLLLGGLCRLLLRLFHGGLAAPLTSLPVGLQAVGKLLGLQVLGPLPELQRNSLLRRMNPDIARLADNCWPGGVGGVNVEDLRKQRQQRRQVAQVLKR